MSCVFIFIHQKPTNDNFTDWPSAQCMIGNEEGHSELFGLLSENTRTDIDLVSKLFVKNIFNSIKN